MHCHGQVVRVLFNVRSGDGAPCLDGDDDEHKGQDDGHDEAVGPLRRDVVAGHQVRAGRLGVEELGHKRLGPAGAGYDQGAHRDLALVAAEGGRRDGLCRVRSGHVVVLMVLLWWEFSR